MKLAANAFSPKAPGQISAESRRQPLSDDQPYRGDRSKGCWRWIVERPRRHRGQPKARTESQKNGGHPKCGQRASKYRGPFDRRPWTTGVAVSSILAIKLNLSPLRPTVARLAAFSLHPNDARWSAASSQQTASRRHYRLSQRIS